MSPKVKQNIDRLINICHKADLAYYNSKPIMTDGQFDNYYFKLKQDKKLYPNNKAILHYFSTIPYNTDNSFAHVHHPYFIGSLDKTRTRPAVSEFLSRWNQNPKSLWYTKSFLIQRKEDGLSMVLYFNDPRMKHSFEAVTRGGGYEGEVVTNELYHYKWMDIDKIRQRIGKRHLVVRGEALIDDYDFNRVNKMNHGKWANSRNLASGTIMNKDPRVCGQRGVFLSAYTIINRDEWTMQYPTELDQLRFLKSLGFHIIEDVHRFPNTPQGKQDILNFMFSFPKNERQAIGHPIDGMVIKPDYTVNLSKIGWNHHGPRYSVSWKFPPKSAIGILQHVRWQESANGKLTPVGILKHPVHILGSDISKASLASVPDIKQRDLRLYDHVVVRRMNDVIPKFVKPVTALRTGNEKSIISTLPKGAYQKGAYYYLKPTTKSLPVILNRWDKFASKQCLNIMGISKKLIYTMIHWHLIDPQDFSSIWNMDEQSFLQIKGFGTKDWSSLQKQLNEAKACPLSKVLLGLPIENAGLFILKPIAQYIHDFKPLLNDTKKRQRIKDHLIKTLPKQKGHGKDDINVINRLFSNEILMQLRHLSNYLQLTEPIAKHAQKPKKSKITGVHFVITGKLSKPRKRISNQLKALGAKVQSSVNGKTDYLVCNRKSNSTKYKAAVAKQVPIINEVKLYQMI